MLTPPLGLCWGTVPKASLLEHIEAAAEAGYSTISVSAEEFETSNRSPSEIRRRLDDLGLVVGEVDPVLTWLPGIRPSPGAGLLSYDVDDLLNVATSLGAHYLNAAAAFPGAWSEDDVVAAFAALCAQAKERDVGVLLEFLPWSVVDDLATAARVVRSSGADNAGVTFDVWHFHRRGRAVASLAADDLGLVRCIQLNDAAAEPAADPMGESISARLLPGDGAIDLGALLPQLLEHAATDVLSLEVFNHELARLPAGEIARVAAEAARQSAAATF